VFAGNVTYDASGDIFNAHNPLEAPLIIVGSVNVGVSAWQVRDTVTLIQNGKYTHNMSNPWFLFLVWQHHQ